VVASDLIANDPDKVSGSYNLSGLTPDTTYSYELGIMGSTGTSLNQDNYG
jgi:hypothetical protein